MSDSTNRTALVTGASAGIGLHYARVLAENGFDLVLTARRKDRLDELAAELTAAHQIAVHCFAHDLSDPQTPQKLADDIEQAGLQIDFLLNNAGYTVPGGFDMARWEAQADLLQVMLTAPSKLVHIFGPHMRKRGYGRIVNVASVAGLIPGVPNGTLYGPIKSYVVKFSQALYSEYKQYGVHVQALCPGFVYTEFHDVAGNRAIMDKMPKYMWLDGDAICRESFRRVMDNAGPVYVMGGFYKALCYLVNLLPLRWSIAMLSRQNRNESPLPQHMRNDL
ncbi:MAG: SDR family NAD(P)-dependent oxidoreductase [Parvibaculales bacterium]